MSIKTFVEQSLGCWRSQRSGHNLAFQHFEEVRSTIQITAVSPDDAGVAALCQTHGFEPELAIAPFHMAWEGESDWDEDEKIAGSCLLVPIVTGASTGKLLRSQGYAETIPAVGEYHFTEEGMFVLLTRYDRAAAEERIWFGTDNLRFRVSLIRTSDGQGVVTASFASEIRTEMPAK
ncbi:MAG: phycobiliprotein lyase [Synechococcales cyanobacterium RM1_1_8]|nr:phycobiliprotein lyase [Synechococcales cyanobacterium RM1_1_8]